MKLRLQYEALMQPVIESDEERSLTRNEKCSLVVALFVVIGFCVGLVFIGRVSVQYIQTENQKQMVAKYSRYMILEGRYDSLQDEHVKLKMRYRNDVIKIKSTPVLLQEINCTHPAMSEVVYASRVLDNQGTEAREQFLKQVCLVLNQLEADILKDYVPLPDIPDTYQPEHRINNFSGAKMVSVDYTLRRNRP